MGRNDVRRSVEERDTFPQRAHTIVYILERTGGERLLKVLHSMAFAEDMPPIRAGSEMAFPFVSLKGLLLYVVF